MNSYLEYGLNLPTNLSPPVPALSITPISKPRWAASKGKRADMVAIMDARATKPPSKPSPIGALIRRPETGSFLGMLAVFCFFVIFGQANFIFSGRRGKLAQRGSHAQVSWPCRLAC